MATPARLIEDLSSVGLDVEGVWDLVNMRQKYPTGTVDVLIDWLQNLDERTGPIHDNEELREALARSLTVREARPRAAPALIEALRQYRGRGDRAAAWAIGNALGVVADDSCFAAIVELATDPELGRARQMILTEALGRSRNPEATGALMSALNEREVSGHAIAGLAKRRDPRARAVLERFLTDDRAWVRREAKKGLSRLNG